MIREVPFWKFVAAIFIIEIPFASGWAYIGSVAAASIIDGDGDLRNATAIREALSEDGGGLWWKLLIGFGSMVVVLKLVHSRVHNELELLQSRVELGDVRRESTMRFHN